MERVPYPVKLFACVLFFFYFPSVLSRIRRIYLCWRQVDSHYILTLRETLERFLKRKTEWHTQLLSLHTNRTTLFEVIVFEALGKNFH